MNGDLKLPIAYFFNSSMDSYVRSNLIKHCLEWLYDTGAIVYTITFDGLKSNICTAENLGARLQPDSNWVPYFPHPVKPKPGETAMPPIYVMLDAAHMVKLWRNVFGSSAQLQDFRGRSISFEHVKKLHALQEKEDLRAENKLSSSHVNFSNNKEKNRFAAQFLSISVADAIDACREDWKLPEFRGSEATAEFIRIVDTIFDTLNSTNLRTRNPYKKALCNDNIAAVRQTFAEAREYIRGLKVKGPKK